MSEQNIQLVPIKVDILVLLTNQPKLKETIVKQLKNKYCRRHLAIAIRNLRKDGYLGVKPYIHDMRKTKYKLNDKSKRYLAEFVKDGDDQ